MRLNVKADYSENTVRCGAGEVFSLAIRRFVQDKTFLAMNGGKITDITIADFAFLKSNSIENIYLNRTGIVHRNKA
jgi:NDP-sugar pyrophosphorylase family protein